MFSRPQATTANEATDALASWKSSRRQKRSPLVPACTWFSPYFCATTPRSGPRPKARRPNSLS